MYDTIAAIATSMQDGAISIIRISGSDAIEIVDKIFDKPLKNVKSHSITYGYIKENNELIDEVLVSVFKAPKSFTCEDVVEINTHGGIYITRRVLQLVLANGARLANPGEFSQRAFLNGRIDLTQAEAVMDMISARNEADRKLAINQLRGSIKKLLDPFIKDILDIIAHIEVNIDYPEYEDIEQLSNDVLIPIIDKWIINMKKILNKAISGQLVKDGIDVAIIGKPNVGKSSLLNALLEEDKAIVTDIEGTTRDLVEGVIMLGNLKLNLIDTAGIRKSEDIVEQIGIDKSIQAPNKAELIIMVIDSSKGISSEEQAMINQFKDRNLLIVNNKKDLANNINGIKISAANNDIEELLDAIHEMYDKHILVIDEPTLSNERQIGLLKKANIAMNNALDALKMGTALDLVEIDIQEAYMSLKEICGEASREDLLDALFSNFCLGK